MWCRTDIMPDDYISTSEQTRYVRADELAQSGPAAKRGWLWPWGIIGLITFLALTGFFMAMLQPKPDSVRINEGSAVSPAATTPLGDTPLVVPPPRVEAQPATISAIPGEPNPPAQGEAPPPTEAPAAPAPLAGEATIAPAILPTNKEAVPPLTGKTPRIAILVMDLGGNAKATQAAIEQLPAEVDLGFSPFGAAAHMKLAIRGGHRVWLGIPMQPKRYPAIDPGPKTLLLKNSAAQNNQHLAWAMQQADPGITGLYNVMGSAFTADRAALAPVMAVARSNGLAFFDTRADSDTVAAKLAREQQIPAAINDAYLDGEGKLAARLDALVKRAKSRGVAVGVLSPHVESIAGLKAWLATPAGQSIELVSVRSVAATADLQKIQP